jgi:hypothetical protein
MKETRKSTHLTDQAHALLLKETKKLWAQNPKTLASRALELAFSDKQIYARLKAEFMR